MATTVEQTIGTSLTAMALATLMPLTSKKWPGGTRIGGFGRLPYDFTS